MYPLFIYQHDITVTEHQFLVFCLTITGIHVGPGWPIIIP